MALSVYKANRGFSLVELSIVLVILGLLVGGVLSGQSLIRAAELRAVSTEYSRWVAATQTFRDKYFAVPGDMPNATAFWGKDNPICPADTGTTTTPGTCNGNGNGIIGEGTNEIFRYWQQLALASLIEGTYSGVTGGSSNVDAIIGTNVPRSRLSNAGWTASNRINWAGDGAWWYATDYGNFYVFGSTFATGYTNNDVMSASEAWNIDTKLDDGRPGQGNVVAVHWSTCTNSTSQTDLASTTATYKLNANGNACALAFMKVF